MFHHHRGRRREGAEFAADFSGRRGGFHRKWGPIEVALEFADEPQRPRGRRRLFDNGELRLVLLKLIADKPRHGYDLIREIEGLTGGAYVPSPGVVYPTLTLLEEMLLIATQAKGDGDESARKRYAVTEAGSAHLAEREEIVAALFARLGQLGEARQRGERTSVRRAVGNLRQVLANRLGEEPDEAVQDEIVSLIDELARRIEKL